MGTVLRRTVSSVEIVKFGGDQMVFACEIVLVRAGGYGYGYPSVNKQVWRFLRLSG